MQLQSAWSSLKQLLALLRGGCCPLGPPTKEAPPAPWRRRRFLGVQGGGSHPRRRARSCFKLLEAA
eukprot:1256457-Alexandrium_andersonii.AAC.1